MLTCHIVAHHQSQLIVTVSRWLEHLTCVQKVMGSTLSGDSYFSLCPMLVIIELKSFSVI